MCTLAVRQWSRVVALTLSYRAARLQKVVIIKTQVLVTRAMVQQQRLVLRIEEMRANLKWTEMPAFRSS